MAALPEHKIDPGGSWTSRIHEHAAELFARRLQAKQWQRKDAGVRGIVPIVGHLNGAAVEFGGHRRVAGMPSLSCRDKSIIVGRDDVLEQAEEEAATENVGDNSGSSSFLLGQQRILRWLGNGLLWASVGHIRIGRCGMKHALRRSLCSCQTRYGRPVHPQQAR
jgi:hypothetical protein